jgi:hypothetical protein
MAKRLWEAASSWIATHVLAELKLRLWADIFDGQMYKC